VTRAANSRSADPEALAAEARALAPALSVRVVASPVEALATAWTMCSRVVVAGSIFLLGDIMKEIGA
jgi:folylpolyglutamate synthase/dihydropteroate synthase